MSDRTPTKLASLQTLRWFGLHSECATMIWTRWQTLEESSFKFNPYIGDFGHFTRAILRSNVEYVGCDTVEAETDWSPNLREIGADERLIDAITKRGPEYDGIRLTKSAAEWVDLAIEWKWEWLHHINQRQQDSSVMPQKLNMSPTEVITVPQVDEQDVTKIRYSRANNSVVDANGGPLDYIPLWRSTSRVKAEEMWTPPKSPCRFSVSNQLDIAPTDFSARQRVQSWTPDLEGAQMYAQFAEKLAEPAEACLVRIEVPLALFEKQSIMILRSPDDQWRKVVWHSRRGEKLPEEDGELQRTLKKRDLLIGDIAIGVGKRYGVLGPQAHWSEVDEKCVLKLKSGEPMTQYVFGFQDYYEDDDLDLEEEINDHPDRASIRLVEQPNVKLLPSWTAAQIGGAVERMGGRWL